MLLKAKALADQLRSSGPETLTIVPRPDPDVIEKSGVASIDLRLGRWLTTFRLARVQSLDVFAEEEKATPEPKITKQHYVPFGQRFYLHPGTFVLGTTLEWIQLPARLGGFVGGKSSWGRRGLIIETAAGVHPGFAGCLTLEITNLGEIPIAIVPGMPICQLVFHQTTDDETRNQSGFNGKRKPALGSITMDPVLKRLMKN